MTRLWTKAQPITVAIDEVGFPIRFTWNGVTHPVERVANYWRADSDWWRGRIWREYFKVATKTGLLVVIYRNLLTDTWHLERLYD